MKIFKDNWSALEEHLDPNQVKKEIKKYCLLTDFIYFLLIAS